MTVIETIGNTPLVELRNIWDPQKTGVRLLAKLEGANPGGSVKDRPAYYMLKAAIESGELTADKTILEPTSGNTGIGLAMLASALGYKVKLVMPACVSQERRAILLALGAELELTPGSENTDGAIKRAHYIIEHYTDLYFMPNQFANDANWRSHYETTAPEIIEAAKGEVDVFTAGMGTSGTLMGCARYFKDRKLPVKTVGIEPTPDHRIQGLKNMQASIVPAIYQPELLSGKINCSDSDAFDIAKCLARREGLFCGISSGAAVWGAMRLARDLDRGSTVVTILPDRGDRYLSTEVFRSVCAECPP